MADHGPYATAAEWSEGNDDDAASLVESSLFYSCMSTASAIANAADCDHEHDEADDVRVVCDGHGDGVIPYNNGEVGRLEALIDMPSSSDLSHPENIDNDSTVRKPPSDSSWSIPSEGERPKVRSITFNRDRTCLIICTSIGVRIRTLESLQLSLQNLAEDEELNNTIDNQRSGCSCNWVHDVSLPPDGATYAQLLHSTSLLAVVKPSSPRCCYLYNVNNASSPLSVLPLSAAIKRVELQRNVLAAMTVDLRLHVFHLTDDGGSSAVGQSIDRRSGVIEAKTLRPTLITTLNIMHPSDSPRSVTRGIDGFNAGSYFDLSPSEEEPYLICKSFNGSPGTIRVYDPTIVHAISVPSGNASIGSEGAKSTESAWDNDSVSATTKIRRRIHFITSIDAHDHSVNRMLIGGGNEKAQPLYLATTSAHGTRIRVFGLPNGETLWEWHRGSKACQIYSLSWNGTADRLAAYGSSGTIHLFEWQKEKRLVVPDHDDVDEGSRDFDHVHDTMAGRPRTVLDDKSLTSEDSKPFFRRIASSIKLHTSGRNNPSSQVKNRSFAKLKYKPSPASSNTNAAKTQALVLSLLNRNHDEDRIEGPLAMEDTLIVCTLDGELRRYSVKNNSMELTQVEDVLSRV
ncbi:hypothetical protein ACHAWU_002790 [Discostella pseudostelligera]|uniref:Uncharacterized protein n=1 Tax=Discostella pseudostelligera TaxID=259834 RepID=A0ABD3M1K4_9STRA